MSIPLAIVGCGKMGRLVEQLAPEYGFDVRERFSRLHLKIFPGLRPWE
jgi:hypothetical protein